jgi:hypothetical protein
VQRARHRARTNGAWYLLGLALAWGVFQAVVGIGGGHLDSGRLSQMFGLQGSQWARHQTWGHRWWSYVVWIWPLVTALGTVRVMSTALRPEESSRARGAAVAGFVSMLVLGFIVIAGTPGLLSATEAQTQSRLLFCGVFVLPIPVLLAGAAVIGTARRSASRSDARRMLGDPRPADAGR